MIKRYKLTNGTVLSSITCCAIAVVIVDQIGTVCTIFTWVWKTFINIYREGNATHELFVEQESVFVKCGTLRQGTETLDFDQALQLYGDTP